MSAVITHRYGDMEDYDASKIPALIAELHDQDDEHPDVSVSHESGWTISAFGSGRVIWENLDDDDPPRHMTGAAEHTIAQLMHLVATAEFDQINAYDWLPGYQ